MRGESSSDRAGGRANLFERASARIDSDRVSARVDQPGRIPRWNDAELGLDRRQRLCAFYNGERWTGFSLALHGMALFCMALMRQELRLGVDMLSEDARYVALSRHADRAANHLRISIKARRRVPRTGESPRHEGAAGNARRAACSEAHGPRQAQCCAAGRARGGTCCRHSGRASRIRRDAREWRKPVRPRGLNDEGPSALGSQLPRAGRELRLQRLGHARHAGPWRRRWRRGQHRIGKLGTGLEELSGK